MKSAQSLIQALLLATSIVFLSLSAAAQDEAHLPPELSPSSSVAEILGWLDRTSFAYARVGLKKSTSPGLSSSPDPSLQEDKPGHKVVFSPGFRLSRVGGCSFTLKNEDTDLIDYSKNIRDSERHFAAELYVTLGRLSPTKGKAPYRHTKNPKKARLVGEWQTEYRYKGFFKRIVGELTLFSMESKERTGFWDGETLTFTFDSKEMSEKFDAAFRQAVRLCAEK